LRAPGKFRAGETNLYDDADPEGSVKNLFLRNWGSIPRPSAAGRAAKHGVARNRTLGLLSLDVSTSPPRALRIFFAIPQAA
jgi:hypothetical protein